MSDISHLLDKSIYIHEKNEFGHLVIILKDLIGIKTNKANVDLFINKIIEQVQQSLKISEKYGKKEDMFMFILMIVLLVMPLYLYSKN